MSIKTTLAAAAIGTAGIVTAAVGQEAPSIVLVHGAWANGSSWEAVVPRSEGEAILHAVCQK